MAQPVQPGAQQRRRLHLGGEHAAGTADEGLDPQPGRPGPHFGGAEASQPVAHRPGPLADVERWISLYRQFWEGRLDALARHLDETP